MLTYDFSLHSEIGALLREATNLTTFSESEELRHVVNRGLTRQNFVMVVKYAMKEGVWRILLDCNGPTKAKEEAFEHVFSGLVEETEFYRNTSKKYQLEYRSSDIDELVEQAELLRAYVEANDLGRGSEAREAKTGVNFSGSQFDRLKERGATMSGMFGNLVCQASGMNLTMTQAEYYVEAGEIDGVEFDENGKVLSIYECQSGIHHGNELDEVHLNKALGSYLYDPEVIPTVRKVVILAGAYSGATLGILKERALELSRRDLPIELVALVTNRTDNRIGVERVTF
jgi:hypothetical protein